MPRLTYKQKLAAIERMTADERPIMAVVKAKKVNNSPKYSSDEIRERSRKTASKRVARYKAMAERLASD